MISIEELRKIIGDSGTSDEVWDKILHEVDADGNGEIDIKEFQRMMLLRF
jgi:Ca2+-binding EF-hand superfamily protein